TALLTTMTDPGKMMRWAMLPMDPKLWGMMMNTLNPGMYMKWMMSPLDPKAINLMVAPMNPNYYMGWLGAGMDPKTYGPMWSGFLNPAATAIPTASTPWGTTGYGAAPATGTAPAVFNPFDPNAWAQMFPVPGTQAPAAQPAQPAQK
ncbi:MAG: hypothetical protein ACUVT2_04865, partial [Thiobacillaceae bacterium]